MPQPDKGFVPYKASWLRKLAYYVLGALIFIAIAVYTGTKKQPKSKEPVRNELVCPGSISISITGNGTTVTCSNG